MGYWIDIFFRPRLARALWIKWNVEAESNIVYSVNPFGVLGANRHFCQQTGYTLKELKTIDLDNILVEEDKEFTYKDIEEVINMGWYGVRYFQNRWKHGKTGENIIMKWQTVKVGDEFFICHTNIEPENLR